MSLRPRRSAAELFQQGSPIDEEHFVRDYNRSCKELDKMIHQRYGLSHDTEVELRTRNAQLVGEAEALTFLRRVPPPGVQTDLLHSVQVQRVKIRAAISARRHEIVQQYIDQQAHYSMQIRALERGKEPKVLTSNVKDEAIRILARDDGFEKEQSTFALIWHWHDRQRRFESLMRLLQLAIQKAEENRSGSAH